MTRKLLSWSSFASKSYLVKFPFGLKQQLQTIPVRHAQLKQPIRSSFWCDLDDFDTSSSAAKVQWHKDTLPLAKHSRQELKIFFPLWTQQTDEETLQKAVLDKPWVDTNADRGQAHSPHAGLHSERGRARLEGTQPLFLHKHAGDECMRTSLMLNKSVFFCLIGN